MRRENATDSQDSLTQKQEQLLETTRNKKRFLFSFPRKMGMTRLREEWRKRFNDNNLD